MVVCKWDTESKGAWTGQQLVRTNINDYFCNLDSRCKQNGLVSILHIITLRHTCIHGVYGCICLYAHALVPQILWSEDSENISCTTSISKTQ